MDWLNPVEWAAWLYGKAFQAHAIRGGIIVVTVFAGIGLFVWIRGVDKYKEEHHLSAEASESTPKPKAATVSETPLPTGSVAASVSHQSTASLQSGVDDYSKKNTHTNRVPIASVMQQSLGDCSPNIVGDNNTVCNPPPVTLNPSLRRLAENEEGRFVFDRKDCPVHTQIRINPSQAVAAPISVTLDFDSPITKIESLVDGVQVHESGGRSTVGIHARTAPISPGISPQYPLIVEVCSDGAVNLTGTPQLVR